MGAMNGLFREALQNAPISDVRRVSAPQQRRRKPGPPRTGRLHPVDLLERPRRLWHARRRLRRHLELLSPCNRRHPPDESLVKMWGRGPNAPVLWLLSLDL